MIKNQVNKEKFIAVVKKYLSSIEGIDQLLEYLEFSGFYEDPASYKYHSSYPTGLMNHSVLVVQNLLKLTKKFDIKWQRPESPYIIGLFHDLCKAGTYEVQMRNVKNDETGEWEKKPFYSPMDNEPLGHGSKSVILLQKFIKLTDQEIYCIYHHMGAFSEKEVQYAYTAACKVWPEVTLVALADQWAGIMEDREEQDMPAWPFKMD